MLLLVPLALVLTLADALKPTRLIYEYPDVGTWIENIATRSDGSLLLTSIGKPGGLNLLRPGIKKTTAAAAPLQLLKNFPHNATLGIVETGNDVFHFIASNFSLSPPLGTVPGTNSVWRYCFKRGLKQILAIPEAGFLNGLTKFNDTLLLAADSEKGAVWAIDLKVPKAYILVQDPLMQAPVSAFKLGINGLHLYHHQLYFTNSQNFAYNVIDLDTNARPRGSARLVAKSLQEKGLNPEMDDFSLDSDGTAHVAMQAGNSVQRVTRDGHVEIIAGGVNSTVMIEPTSTAMGRRPKDRHTLYVTTAGGFASPVYVNGTSHQSGAQIVAVDLQA